MLRKLQQVLNYGFVSLFLISFIQSCPVTMIREDWKPMPLVERARNAHVVAVGKAVEVYDDHSITDKPLKVGGFQLFDILKGQQIIEKIYANKSGPIFYILGFGNPAQCLADIEEGETYLLFAIFVPEKFALVAAYETPRGGTATATIENQDQILASLGWRPWSEWSSCSVSCSGGWQSRTRRCRVGNCEGSTTKSRDCNNYLCQGLKNLLRYFKLRRNTRSLITAPPTHRDAFQINSLGNLSVPTHQIFWNQFPRQFTMFAVAKYVNYTGGYLVSFYDAQDRLQIGIKVSKTSVALEYAQAGKKNQLIAFNVEVIDRKWHQFAFSVGDGVVSFYLDCESIGTQNIAQQTVDGVDRNGNVYLSAKTNPPQETNENIEFYIEELSLSNDAKAGQQQCVFKNLYTEEEEWSGSGTIKPVTLEYKWTKWTSCSKTCGSNGVRRRVRMCTEISWKDSKDECQTLLQKSQEEPCNNNIPCPAHCQQRCVNGVCAAKNKCKCKKNYYGPNCENKRAASCKRECNNGGRCLTSKGICKCPKGFVGKYCEKATCIPACRHGGTCVKPGVCKCRPGYLPPNCKPSCRPSCMNKGLCIRPNRCHCIKEFSGSRCQYAVCKKPCLNGGVCYDNNKCNCKSGWTGDTCNIAICRPKCLNGGQCRLPNRCSCPNKTSGTYCQNVECNPGCHNGGRCLRQNICLCSHKYSGARCQTPVCRPNCVNGGKCVAPNQCVCPSGFFGDSCDRRSCIYKTRVVPQKRTEHIPITTSLPKWCSHHMGWRPCTEKKTEYRTVHITTYRTIYYCD